MKKSGIIFGDRKTTLAKRTFRGGLIGLLYGAVCGLAEGEIIYLQLRGFNDSSLMLLFTPLLYSAVGLIAGSAAGIFFHFIRRVIKTNQELPETAHLASLIPVLAGALVSIVYANELLLFPRFHPVSIAVDLVILVFYYYLWKALAHTFTFFGKLKRLPILLALMMILPVLIYINITAYKSILPPPSPADRYLKNVRRNSVIIIVIDTLRADHLGCLGYDKPVSPVIDRLADNGILFRNGFSSSSWTIPAHFSLMTAVTAGAVRQEFSIADGSYTIAERMYHLGYKTACITANPLLSRAVNFHPGFQLFDDNMHTLNRLNSLKLFDFLSRLKIKRPIRGNKIKLNNPASLVTDYAIDWIEKSGSDPYFLFLNYMDVHDPYLPPEKYRDLFSKPYKGKFTGDICGDLSEAEFIKNILPGMTPEDWEYVISQYDATIRYVDDQIKRIVDLLNKQNRLDDTILIILSDHGELFGEYGLATHHLTLSEEEVRVPIIIHYPRVIRNPAQVDTIARIIDIYPTLQKLIGFRLPEKLYIEGTSLIDRGGNPTGGAVYAGATLYENSYKASVLGPAFNRDLFSYRTREWKYLHPEKTGRVNRKKTTKTPFRGEQLLERLYSFIDETENDHRLKQENDENRLRVFRQILRQWRDSIKKKQLPLGSGSASDDYIRNMLLTGYINPY